MRPNYNHQKCRIKNEKKQMSRGKKHKCSNCGKPFYDMNRTKAPCPSCGTENQAKGVRKAPKSRRNPSKDSVPSTQNGGSTLIFIYPGKKVFEDKDSGFQIIDCKVLGFSERVRIKGVTSDLQGDLAVASGTWIEDPKHGLQFDFNFIAKFPSPPTEGLRRILSSDSFPGVGVVLAARILEAFGDKTADVLCDETEKLTEIEGVTSKLATQISKKWREIAANCGIDLFFSELAISPNIRNSIQYKLGSNFLQKIYEDPYALIGPIAGMGFRTADQIAVKLGIPRQGTERIKAGITYILREAAVRDGHCGLAQVELIQRTAELLGIEAKVVEVFLDETELLDLSVCKVVSDQKIFFSPPLIAFEETIASQTLALLASDPLLGGSQLDSAMANAAAAFQFELTQPQLNVIKGAFQSNITVITGGPGVGKTTIIQGIVETLKAAEIKFALCAPTGRASKRLEQSAGEEAKTIHRLLEFNPREGGFARGSKKILSQDVVICDEASMIDVELMSALLEALEPGKCLILVGDVDQLPPVGPGQPFRDFIYSETIPVGRLEQNFRQNIESGIVSASAAVNAGHMPDGGDDIDKDDYYFINRENNESLTDAIEKFISRLSALRGGKFDPLMDVQFLTPMNKGPLGTSRLNELIQNMLNPYKSAGLQLKDHEVTVGDKVIQVKNNYDKDVFNGDIGLIKTCDLKAKTIEVSFDGKLVGYEASELSNNLNLAYAITIHKSQGSEYPVVALIVSSTHAFMLARNLVYTGMTRAREILFVLGQSDAMRTAARKVANTKRLTYLPVALKNGLTSKSTNS
jgi:exodeoxyribonuclease V alpha subunit